MDRLRRTLSFRHRRKKKPATPAQGTTEANKPHQWQEDERKVREGTCSFQVKYLGCVEVFESRGMVVCEEAVKSLRTNTKKASRFSFRRKPRGARALSAILYVSGDSLRVVEDRGGGSSSGVGGASSVVGEVLAKKSGPGEDKGLIVDQTIEKVSFCAPDRKQEKAFAYICRDGTTRRWMCHGFMALKETGERLSHAVGCAFAICLEKKQKRERDAVNVTYSEDKTTFTRLGSFRQATLTERMVDPQSAKIAEPLPLASSPPGGGTGGPQANNGADSGGVGPAAEGAVAAVERPHATPNMLLRQGSFREFSKLNSTTSPFKRNLSLRLNELPSNLQRQEGRSDGSNGLPTIPAENGTSPPIQGQGQASAIDEFDPIANMCKELTQGLSSLSTGVGESSAPTSTGATGAPAPAGAAPGAPATNPWEGPSASLTSDFWLPRQQPAAPQQTFVHQHHQATTATISPPPARSFPAGQPPAQPIAGSLAKPTFGVPNGGLPTTQQPPAPAAVNAASNGGGASVPTPADPFDAAWAMRRTGGGGGGSSGGVPSTNPFQAGGATNGTGISAGVTANGGGGSGVTKSFEMNF